ncbi:lytic transglycosylase domain-containing protein [Mucilaginibacter robiniae]|uniref:Lytic transglycosylase domain-containing protein n=1 Tax=Mucilaginibacter robiniae TaxID=2728022 RepID=A0A7L5DX68_9SPHI|nr:lytic transglycosylase domain-containing protein [Mucilaginibacter robiniae]QJD95690.1 lytic transglycosylase domain-containing protein [Mucilaginibacter robiniae]
MKNSSAITDYISGKKEEKTQEEKTTLKFANEELPAQNVKVKHRLKRSAWRRNLHHLTSTAIQQRANRWLHVIEPILRRYGIPEDFKYIPLLESGFDLHCKSHRGAVGPWQFMPGTAREYGLRVNRSKDERMNIRKSTVAACKYLKELYAQFDSWTLAAAAFNGGSPRIKHAINHRNKGNYAAMHLNYETGTYVYKLAAIKNVLDKPEPINTEPVIALLKPDEILTLN